MDGGITMFFQVKEKSIQMQDTYDKIFELVKAILYFECPEHRAHHHILYTANIKLESYREAKDFYRPFENPATSLGTFSREAYQLATKKYHQLNTIIRGFMHLSDDTKRDHFNHHFRFHAEKITSMHQLYQNVQTHQILNIESLFFDRLKEDISPLLTQFE
jgi:hypothetical protein